MRKVTAVLVLVLLAAAWGCVERKLTVTSTPPGAKIYLDDEPKGETPATFRFNFHGHRTFTLKKDGYGIKEEVRKVRAPFWELPGLDVIAEFTPIPLEDHQKFHFELEPVRRVSTGDLLDRARAMKARMEGKPPPEKPEPTEAEEEPTEKPVPTEAEPTPFEVLPPAETRSGEPPSPDETDTPGTEAENQPQK